jgi:2-oxoisovalerate ferredoxin oxidoreductase beta subunit
MHTIKHQKARSLYPVFERKAPGADVSHYCPGCGHGTAHNLIAEAIDDLGIQDRTIFCSPVGCSVFGYYYFDTGNIQCAHGRAPAVASAIRRTHEDAIIISYQGDGDLAGIGMSQIIHAANRGENITVFFINNAIYGMTGGQMAPTTILNQKTITTPDGRHADREGFPVGMCEIINSLQAPVYVERVSLAGPVKVMKARTAIRRALNNQVEKKGFSFVEILSPCPVNWKMSAVDARRWLENNLEPVFPVVNFRDLPKGPFDSEGKNKTKVSDHKILEILGVDEENPHTGTIRLKEEQNVKIAGFGGQGVLSAGILLANCAIAEGLKTTWLPSYGAEMRGGTANANINISHETIGSPIVSFPNALIVMNLPSLDAFEDTVRPGGAIFVNSSLALRNVKRGDVAAYYIPASDLANDLGAIQSASVILLTVYAMVSGSITIETLRNVIPLSIKRKNLIELNMRAIDAGISWYKENVLNTLTSGD